MARLVAAPAHKRVRGTRVVLDVRPLQEPERTPLTADYLDRLLEAYTAQPLAGESFVIVSRTLRPDPTRDLEVRGLPVAARRLLPPTSRLFRSAGLTLDSFLLRGAEIGTLRGRVEAGDTADPASAADGPPAVFHTAGGAVPLASQLPVVATLLDLAPWELPHAYAASPAARFGHRLRARVLHDAARVIVASRQTAASARRLLLLPEDRLAVVPLAVDAGFRAAGRDEQRTAAVRQRLGLPEHYFVFSGRYDARKDLGTLLRALRTLREAPPERAGRGRANRAAPPPLLVLALQYADASDGQLLERVVARSGPAEGLRVASGLDDATRAALVGGASGFVYPALSESTGLPVLEALSLGVPVIASRTGALPEIVGSAGIVVEPRDPNRLAAAITALASEGSLAEQLRRAARVRADGWSRTWADVAAETRQVYADAAAGGRAAGAARQRRDNRRPAGPE